MDREEVQLKIEYLKSKDLKISEHLTDEEWGHVFTFPRPTPERMAANREKAALTRALKREEREKMHRYLAKDSETQLNELVPLAYLVIRDAMHDPNVNVKLRAAIEVLNRRFGRPKQQIDVSKPMDDEKIVYSSAVLDAMKEGNTASS